MFGEFNYFMFLTKRVKYLLSQTILIFFILFLFIETQHENTLHYNIIRVTRQETRGNHDTTYIKKLMGTINKMMYSRYEIFNGTEELSWKNSFFHSVDADITYGAGACGGFSKVLARSLSLSGYKVRIGQMKVNGKFGGHIIVEVLLPENNKWVVIDPLFLITFKSKNDGNWASFWEIKSNWPYYKSQIKSYYNFDYNYEDVRYTNWDKFEYLGKYLYELSKLFLNEENVRTFSARIWMLNMYSVYLALTISIFFLNNWFLFLRYLKFRKMNSKV